jgi:hypothetical protein
VGEEVGSERQRRASGPSKQVQRCHSRCGLRQGKCIGGRQAAQASSFAQQVRHNRPDCTSAAAAAECGGSPPGGKLNRPCELAPIHSPTSLALAREVAKARMRMGRSSWLEM